MLGERVDAIVQAVLTIPSVRCAMLALDRDCQRTRDRVGDVAQCRPFLIPIKAAVGARPEQ